MDKQIFTDYLRSLYLKSNEILQRRFTNQELFGEKKRKYIIESESSISSGEIMATDYRICLIIIKEELVKTDEFKKVVALVLSDFRICSRINCMIQVYSFQLRFEDNDLILGALRHIYENMDKNRKMDDLIVEAYEKIESFYESKEVAQKGVVYLDNIAFAQSKLAFGEDIALQTLSKEDKINRFNEDKHFEFLYGFTSSKPWVEVITILEFTFKKELLMIPYEKMDNHEFKRESDPEILNRIHVALNAIRLMNEEFMNTSHMYINWYHSPFDFNTEPRPLYVGNPPPRTKVSLSLDQCDDLFGFYNRLCQLVLRETENIALHRLARISSRETFEDQFLDLFIGFEAIVLGEISGIDDVQGEMRYRLSIVTSKFLEKDPVEQKRVFNIMKKGYDLRSAIVHGKSIHNNEQDVKLFIELAGIYKRLLKKWLNERGPAGTIDISDILFN